MGFYYVSIMSAIPLGIAYGLLALVFWGIERATRGFRKRRLLLNAVGVVFLVLPISEELWIAWNFSQACQEAGMSIHKKVRVDGFYDDTTHWWRQLQDSQYQQDTQYRFVESRDPSTNAIWRVEREGSELRHLKLEGPSAKYHFRNMDPMNGTPWAHKVVRSGSSVVIDAETNEELARYVSFSRRPPWFYVGLDTPGFGCDSPGDWPYTRRSGLIYRDVLIPSDQR